MAGQTAQDRLRTRPDFVAFWTAFTVSSFGTYVTTLAIQVLVVVTLHEGAAEVGLVNAARWLPYLLFGILVGALVDRVRRRPVLVAADLGRGLLLVAIPVLALLDALSVWMLAGFMVCFGLLSVAGDAASQSFLPRLVPRPLLTAANARLDTSDAAAQASGPALAGALVGLLTAPWAVLVDAGSYLASALLLMRVRVVEPPRRRVTLQGLGGELAQGLRWVYRHRTLTPYALGNHAWFLVNAAAGAVVPVFALRTLGLSALGFGALVACAGVGAVAGSLAATRLAHGFGVGRTVVAGTLGTAAGWALVTAAGDLGPVWLLFGAGQLLVGLSMGAQNASEMSYRQVVTPDELQGRTNATVRSVNRAMIVIGAPLAGLLADGVGTRYVLAGAATGFVLVALVLACTPYRTARLDDPYALALHPPGQPVQPEQPEPRPAPESQERSTGGCPGATRTSTPSPRRREGRS